MAQVGCLGKEFLTRRGNRESLQLAQVSAVMESTDVIILQVVVLPWRRRIGENNCR